ncbi:MAG: hypothetical protein EBR23_12580, partial [Planctomycetia bacterium]|nr:hypothetical protein [Planctomycetia bacterium]
MTTHRHAASIFMAALVLVTTARADNSLWTGAGSNALWSTTDNWLITPVPGPTDTASFLDSGNGNTTVDLGSGVTVGAILFDSSSVAAYTIGSGAVGSQNLTLDPSIGTITMSASVAANETFNANVLLGTGAAGTWTFTNNSTTNTLLLSGAVQGGTGGSAGAQTLTVGGDGNTTISGTIRNGGASSLALTKSGAGTLALSGTNTFTGGATLNGGTLLLNSRGALGTIGTIGFAGGTLRSSANNALDYSSRFSTAANQAYSLDTNGQAVMLATALTSSGGSLTKLGNGTLTLAGANTYTGATTISGGTLQIGWGFTSGALAAGSSITNNGTLAFNRTNAVTQGTDFSTAGITGTGALVQMGTSTLALNANNAYTGSTTVNLGTLTVSGAAGAISGTSGIALNSGTVTVTNLAAEFGVNRIADAAGIASNGGTF